MCDLYHLSVAGRGKQRRRLLPSCLVYRLSSLSLCAFRNKMYFRCNLEIWMLPELHRCSWQIHSILLAVFTCAFTIPQSMGFQFRVVPHQLNVCLQHTVYFCSLVSEMYCCIALSEFENMHRSIHRVGAWSVGGYHTQDGCEIQLSLNICDH